MSGREFIVKGPTLNPSCVLEAGFVSLETLREGQGYDLGETSKSKEISRDQSF